MSRAIAIVLLMGLASVIAGCVVAEPQPYRAEAPPDFYKRIENQQARIDAGIGSGQLTRNEANILQDNLNWIKAEYARLTRDGRLGPGEMRRLDRMLDQNSQMIHNKRNNPIMRLY